MNRNLSSDTIGPRVSAVAAAAALVRDGVIIGLGTGSTASFTREARHGIIGRDCTLSGFPLQNKPRPGQEPDRYPRRTRAGEDPLIIGIGPPTDRLAEEIVRLPGASGSIIGGATAE